MPLYQLNKFYWWITLDEKSWQPWALYDAQNVDLSNTNKVILSRNRFDQLSYIIWWLNDVWHPVAPFSNNSS